MSHNIQDFPIYCQWDNIQLVADYHHLAEKAHDKQNDHEDGDDQLDNLLWEVICCKLSVLNCAGYSECFQVMECSQKIVAQV